MTENICQQYEFRIFHEDETACGRSGMPETCCGLFQKKEIACVRYYIQTSVVSFEGAKSLWQIVLYILMDITLCYFPQHDVGPLSNFE